MEEDDVCDVCGTPFDGFPTCGKCAGRELAELDEYTGYHYTVDGIPEMD